ncbi:OB-fold nucleic acid binding domain-containing protein [Halocatena salina]|uniref:OB-fold nucleic acid binding domain-containing protein n=1 Tax=Halocatena salina TaxID=2934340 RepID=A0A8U0A5D3_9EURY|nr:OB-fold nucleic acid binding domain-containing protein [Halocatena salina]UPM43678.1 OB-fold nucleic acid binding domain-containing protein [Halocatena salina]
MSEQIVTGDSLEDQIGNLHKEDVVLDFAGTRPDQLIVDCYYRGTVDGYADFGIFVNLGDHVTGLLHRSELPHRLESLSWEKDDTVYVQVTNVRDNGNVDLGWSLRDSAREFRGEYIHDPENTLEPEEVDSHSDQSNDDDRSDQQTQDRNSELPDTEIAEDDFERGGSTQSTREVASENGAVSSDLNRTEIEQLQEQVGDIVRLEGLVTDVRQTSGPTVFSVQDETDVVDCAAFVGAGVRAYPEISTGDYVGVVGEVRERRSELQVETEQIDVVTDEDETAIVDRMDEAVQAKAEVEPLDPLAPDSAVESVIDAVREGATTIRRAVIESRPIVVRHQTSVDGYLAGAALERAILPLIEDEHTAADAVYHFFDRRPLEGAYDMDDATNDVTSLLGSRDRHQQKRPLFVFVATGGTSDSLDGLDLLQIYDTDVVVLDSTPGDADVQESVSSVVNPALAGNDEETSTAAIATAIAVHVNPNSDVRADLSHLPAASFWEDVPEIYTELAREGAHSHSPSDTANLREAIALKAYYQSYDGKRELISDLLFEESVSKGLAEQVSEQFREKLAGEVQTAEENLDRRDEDGLTFAVLDTDAFTHRFDFPPTDLLLDEIHRRNRDGTFVTLGVDTDQITIRSTTPFDLSDVVERLQDDVPSAGVTARDGHNRIGFVAGEREHVREAIYDAIASTLGQSQTN